jgi:tetratricopeptide (TPR) repeat protein
VTSQDPTAAQDPTTAAALAAPPTVPPVATGTDVAEPLRPWTPIAWFLAFVAIALVANSGAFRGPDFLWTDRALIQDNTFLRSLGGLQRIWAGILDPEGFRLSQYAPLAQATFFFDRLIWGEKVGGFRLTSCLLHATTGLMLWYLLRRLAVPGAILVALLFVAHPMTVESVSLLSERRTILATLFGLASTFLVLRAAGAIRPVAGGARAALPDDPLRLYAMAAVLFVLGLFAHPIIALLPIVSLLIVWWRRVPIDPTLVGATVAMAIAGCAMLGFVSSVERANSHVPADQWRRDVTLGGDAVMRAQLAGRGVAFYATKLAVPFPLMSSYPRVRTPQDVASRLAFLTANDRARLDQARERLAAAGELPTPAGPGDAAGEPTTAPASQPGPPSPGDRKIVALATPQVTAGSVVAWLPLAVVVAALAGLALSQKKIGRAPIVTAAAFVLCLIPVLGIVDLGWMWDAFVADRAAYLASIPFLAGLVALVVRFLSAPEQRIAAISTLAVVLLAYVGLGANVSSRYTDSASFWEAAANTRRGNPQSTAALLGYADAMVEQSPPNVARAVYALENARVTRPSDPAVHIKIGKVREHLRLVGDALNSYIFVMDNFSEDPRGFLAAADLSRRLANVRPTDPKPRGDALRYYREAAARDPRDPWTQVWLGVTAFEIAARLPDQTDPQIPELVQEAAVAFDHAFENDPYDPDKLVLIARTSIAMGKYAFAGNLLRSAITYGKDRADAYELIADATIATGDPKLAESALRRAIELEPDAARPRVKLGAMMQAQRRFEEAKKAFARVLELDPDNEEAKQRLAEAEAGDPGTSTTRPTTRATTRATTQAATWSATAPTPLLP